MLRSSSLGGDMMDRLDDRRDPFCGCEWKDEVFVLAGPLYERVNGFFKYDDVL